MPEFDERSERNIASLRPKAQPHFRALLRKLKARAAEDGLDVRYTSGNRTPAEQDALYAQGRTEESKARGERIVTKARAWQSNHNYGLAVDITLFRGNQPVWESPLYATLGALAEPLGLAWGGAWTTPDEPHFELWIGFKPAGLKQIVDGEGWEGIDRRIPDSAPTPTPPSTPPVLPAEPVVVLAESDDPAAAPEALPLVAWYREGRTWVAIRDWTDRFGGGVQKVNGRWRLALNGEVTRIATETLDGRTIARFGDINQVLGWDYTFDGKSRPRRLIIHHPRIG